jgi:hypothetical protein
VLMRCPACGKENKPAPEASCPRCGCDLSMLFSVVRAAVWHLAESAMYFRMGDWKAAQWHAEKSWKLRKTLNAAHLAFLAAAALGDSERAWQWLPKAR